MNNQNPPAVKPEIRADIVATITPEEIAAAMLRLLGEARAKNNGISVIRIEAIKYEHRPEPVIAWAGHGIGSACQVSQPSFADLVAALDAEIGTKQEAAKRLREKAAAMLAKADALEAPVVEGAK